jgi:hypothetical protein
VNTYYHISPDGAENPLAEMAAADFFEMDQVRGLMQQAGETVQAHGLDLPASFFGTSICNLCSTKLIFLAQYNKILDLSLEHLTFQIRFMRIMRIWVIKLMNYTLKMSQRKNRRR